MSKTFGKMLFNKTNDYIKPFSSDLLTVLQRNQSTQYDLIKILEKLKHLLDHHLFLAKLDTYVFFLTSTTIIQNYLNKRMQKVNVDKENVSVEGYMYVFGYHSAQY